MYPITFHHIYSFSFILKRVDGSNTLNLITTECSVNDCKNIPQKSILLIRGQIFGYKKVFDLPITLTLIDRYGLSASFKKSIIPITLKEKSFMDNPLLIDVYNPNNRALIFVINDYESIFDIDEQFGAFFVKVPYFNFIIYDFVHYQLLSNTTN